MASGKESGFGYLKLQIAGMLHTRDVERIATARNFPPSTRDRLRKSDDPSLALLDELESRGIISETDISSLIITLNQLNLKNAAGTFDTWFHNMKKSNGAVSYIQHKLASGLEKAIQTTKIMFWKETGQQTVYPSDEDYMKFLKEVEDHLTKEVLSSLRRKFPVSSYHSKHSSKNVVRKLQDDSILTQNDISKFLDALNSVGLEEMARELQASFEGYKREDCESSETGSPIYEFELSEESTANAHFQIRMLKYHEQVLHKEAKIRVCHIGKRNCNEGDVKCLLLFGKSGDGKTTMLNSLVNKILGVKWTDPFRYKLKVDEDEARTKSKAEGQTKWISAYYLHGHEVVIVDTPGFCDQKGTVRDNFITNQIGHFFSEDLNFLSYVNAIAFIMKASDSRLNDLQRSVFELVLNLFGEDITPHLYLFATFSTINDTNDDTDTASDTDESEVVPVAEAAKMAGVKFGKIFPIDNVSLYHNPHRRPQGSRSERNAKKMAQRKKVMNIKWDWTDQSLSDFFEDFQNSSFITTEKSARVIEGRFNLQQELNGIIEVIKSTVVELAMLEKDKQVAKSHRLELLEKKFFEYSVTKEIVTKEYISSNKAIVCHNCQRTCQKECNHWFVTTSQKMRWLSILRGCSVCTKHCSVFLHQRTNYMYQREKITFIKNSEQLLAENKASNKVITIVDQIEKKETESKAILKQKTELAKYYISKLKDSAFRKNVKSFEGYLREMIWEEKKYDPSEGNRRLRLLLDLLSDEIGTQL